jgi:hypothetical protein
MPAAMAGEAMQVVVAAVETAKVLQQLLTSFLPFNRQQRKAPDFA